MNKSQESKEVQNALIKTSDQVAWLIANTAATNIIIRSLAEANKENPLFLDALKKLHASHIAITIPSPMSDGSIAEYEKAIKELLPTTVVLQ
ncbi:MAG: hypothetical protein PHH58_08635 [Rhodoferax sp.]|nr:hypothetical protein [Rhodoferax sp.]